MKLFKRIVLGIFLLLVMAAVSLYTPDKSFEELKEKYTSDGSFFVELEGMNVHFKKEGQGFPILLLHGTGSSLHTWDGWTKELTDSFTVYRLDLPAYGLTGPFPDRDYSQDHYLTFLNSFAEKLAIDSFHIAGNSFGGALAFSYAARYPDDVCKLILVDPGGIDDDREPPSVFKLANNPIAAAILKKVTPKSFIEKNMIEVYGNDDLITDELVTRYHDFAIREGNRQAFVDRVKTQHSSIQHYLSQLEEPTLIQWGSEDHWIPVAHAAIMDSLIPDSRVIIYDGVGHVPMEESPKITVADAKAFLLE